MFNVELCCRVKMKFEWESHGEMMEYFLVMKLIGNKRMIMKRRNYGHDPLSLPV